MDFFPIIIPELSTKVPILALVLGVLDLCLLGDFDPLELLDFVLESYS
jgi:hypothetical protein